MYLILTFREQISLLIIKDALNLQILGHPNRSLSWYRHLFPSFLFRRAVSIMHGYFYMHGLSNWLMRCCRQLFLVLSLWRVHHTGWLLKLFFRLVIACKHNISIYLISGMLFDHDMSFLYYLGLEYWFTSGGVLLVVLPRQWLQFCIIYSIFLG